METLKGRNPEFELRKIYVLDEMGIVVRDQLGFAGLKIGDRIKVAETDAYMDPAVVWLVESNPEPTKDGVLAVTASPV